MTKIDDLTTRALRVAAQVIQYSSTSLIGPECRYRQEEKFEAADMIHQDRKDLDDVYAMLVMELRDRRKAERENLRVHE